MTDWNPTDDELRAIAGLSDAYLMPAHVRDLARLVLRERADLVHEREEFAALMGRQAPDPDHLRAANFALGWGTSQISLAADVIDATRAEAADYCIRAEQAEAALARVQALCDAAENRPWRSVMFGGEPFPVSIHVEEIRAALWRSAMDEES